MNLSNLNYSIRISKKINFLLKYIDSFIDSKNIENIYIKLSRQLKIPLKEIKFYQKKILFNSFNFKSNKFDNKINFLSIIKYFLIYHFYIITIFLFRDKKKFQNKIKNKRKIWLIDKIMSPVDFKRYYQLSKNTPISFKISDNNLKKKSNYIFLKKYFRYNTDFNDYKFFFKISFKILRQCLITKKNLYYLILSLIESNFYYKLLFNKYNVSFLISHLHYDTNNISNFYLRKKKGKCIIIQKNINARNHTGYFYDADICFSIGKKIKLHESKYSRISKQIPLGSFFMENHFHLQKKQNKFNYDLVIIGGNQMKPNGFFDNSKYHRIGYKKHLEWIKILSKKYPHLKIGFKHHSNYIDNYEKRYFSGSGVKMVNRHTNSYHLAASAKLVLSWASTMIIELRSINTRSFFLNPYKTNDQFMTDIYNPKDIIINNFNDIEKKIKKYIFTNSSCKKEKSNDNYCMKSMNYSKKLTRILKDNEIKN